MKRHFALWTLMLCAFLCILPERAWAAEKDIPISGVCGEAVSWTIHGGELTITGSGAMDDFVPGDAPWAAVSSKITSVVVDYGVTSIGAHAFYGCRNLTEIAFRGDMPSIHESAFAGTITWACYPRDNRSWDENTLQNYGGLVVWKDYCLHSMTEWANEAGYDDVLRSVCHRGSFFGPENTLVAYEMAKKQGFSYVEADVQFTKDGVPVLLHDSTIDRTSDGTGSLADYTYEELSRFDFGSWKSERFYGTRIPTLEAFLELCSRLDLKPYIELKAGTPQDEVRYLVELTAACGIQDRATWISFDDKLLEAVAEADPEARLGYLTMELDEAVTEKAQALAAQAGECFVSCYYNKITGEEIEQLKAAGLPLEAGKVIAEASGAAETLAGEKVIQRRSCLWCDHYETRNGDTEPVMANE